MMNERIKELALQAGEYANSVYTPPVRSKTPGKIWEDGHIDWHELFNEKFAELIVGECMLRVRSRQQFATEDQQNVTQAFDLLIYDLESHFGVEE